MEDFFSALGHNDLHFIFHLFLEERSYHSSGYFRIVQGPAKSKRVLHSASS